MILYISKNLKQCEVGQGYSLQSTMCKSWTQENVQNQRGIKEYSNSGSVETIRLSLYSLIVST